MDIEKLIQESLGPITAKGNQKRREKALTNYYNNPCYCKQCGEIIKVKPKERIRDVKRRTFCSIKCTNLYAKENAKSYPNRCKCKIQQLTDAQIIKGVENSNSWIELSFNLGYKNRFPKKSKEELIDRLEKLNLLETFIQKIENPISFKKKTKKEVFENTKNWQFARSQIQKRARAAYQKSDKPKYCVICGYNKTYQVAHIKAVSDFSGEITIEEINSLDNLIALCPNHHWEYDNGLLNLEEYLNGSVQNSTPIFLH